MAKTINRGFSTLEALIVLVIVIVIGGVGYYIYHNRDKNDPNPSTSSQQNDQNQTEEVNIPVYSTFSVTPSEQLSDKGSCTTGQVLFAPIFNSADFDYDCEGVQEATGYASIVFGVSDVNILDVFGVSVDDGQNVKLANGVDAKKFIFEVTRRSNSDNSEYTARYTLYQVEDGTGQFFYGLYWTGLGFADEDFHLGAFNELALNNWQIR